MPKGCRATVRIARIYGVVPRRCICFGDATRMTVEWTLRGTQWLSLSLSLFLYEFLSFACILGCRHRVGEFLENFFGFPRPSPVLDLAFEAQAFAFPRDTTF